MFRAQLRTELSKFNLLVADFYATIGFEKISGGETGSVFRYTVPAERTPLNTVMETVLL